MQWLNISTKRNTLPSAITRPTSQQLWEDHKDWFPLFIQQMMDMYRITRAHGYIHIMQRQQYHTNTNGTNAFGATHISCAQLNPENLLINPSIKPPNQLQIGWDHHSNWIKIHSSRWNRDRKEVSLLPQHCNILIWGIVRTQRTPSLPNTLRRHSPLRMSSAKRLRANTITYACHH